MSPYLLSPYIATALQDLPRETVIDGELVALGLDERGITLSASWGYLSPL